jgi:hypothetical protein
MCRIFAESAGLGEGESSEEELVELSRVFGRPGGRSLARRKEMDEGSRGAETRNESSRIKSGRSVVGGGTVEPACPGRGRHKAERSELHGDVE